MATAAGDIRLGGKDFLLAPRGYRVSESPYSQPRIGRNSAAGLESGDHWSRWNQSDFLGMGEKEWIGDGPFADGWGLNLDTPGQIDIADKLTETQDDTANTGGYVPLVDGTTRLWFIGKTNGTAYHTTNGTTWTPAANTPAVGAKATTRGFLKDIPYVATDNGALYSLSGTTWTEKITKPLSTAAYILGAFRSKLWIGYANKLYYYDGAAWSTEQFTGLVDGTPQMGAVGNTSLFFVSAGPDARVYQTDSNQLFHLGTLPGDFLPKACVFLETLYIFGHDTDETNTRGRVWRLEEGGLVPVFKLGDTTKDYGIRSAEVDGAKILWGANQYTGIGVFDPSMDIYDDVVMGFYVGSVISTLAKVVHGIAQFKGDLYCGIEGDGIYRQDTPGKFRLLTSKFDANSKNIAKIWGFGEEKFSKLLAGQSLTLKTTRDGGTTLDTWGTHNTVGTEAAIIAPPTVTSSEGTLTNGYRFPFMQMELTGDAGGSALSIYDTTLGYVEASDNPKSVWQLVLALEGSKTEPQIMRDESENPRSSKDMVAELKALWNKQTDFEDIDGAKYRVMLKRPAGKLDDLFKSVVDGEIEDLVLFYEVILVQM